MAKIFWVEDQLHWVERFKPVLEAALLSSDQHEPTNEVQVFRFAEAARQRIAQMDADNGPDIAILDANMNGQDQAGFSVLRALTSKWPGLPIIFLSEHNGTAIERDALEQYSAQDFISKHQNNIEEVLCWRLRAALRQQVLQQQPEQLSREEGLLQSTQLKIDTTTWEVYWKNVKLMNPDNPKRPLTPMPRKILRWLVERSPRPVNTEQMAEVLQNDGFTDASYRQHIKTLRRAIDIADGGRGTFIEQCSQGCGIVTHGEANAYLWKPCKDD